MSACDAPAILSDEPEAVARRKVLTDWSPMSLSQLSSSLKKPLPRVVRIYADGVFDLFHNGHANQLRQAKTLLPNSYLIVGVCSDQDVLAFKGTRPVMTQEERCATVRHCRYVDEVYLAPPFYPTLDFVDAIKADFVAHDAIPYNSPESTDCYGPFKKAGRFLTTERTPLFRPPNC
uniref:choline-phosphate cytidylyltransferase n=1 Tax=Ditylenchus dipsaci TaxID=166011 RepID=A0A915D456_9BILA